MPHLIVSHCKKAGRVCPFEWGGRKYRGASTGMINPRDELLHEYKKHSDWIETFSVNLVDRKNKIYGFADINYTFYNAKTEFNWALIVNDSIFTYRNTVDFDGNLTHKTLTDKKFKYRIASPPDNFELGLKNEFLAANFLVHGVHPVYVFPVSGEETRESSSGRGVDLWERYEQRCRITGNVAIAKGPKKGYSKKIECTGHRKHSWGRRHLESMSCYSWLSIQFRDMAMDCTYMEIDNVPYSHGYISRRMGNIPIVSVELELLSFNRDSKTLVSSEFSYKDAQDDRDLIVSKKLYSVDMPVLHQKKNRYLRLRSFSDFTIIGTNKKGIGMEEHYISLDRLNQME